MLKWTLLAGLLLSGNALAQANSDTAIWHDLKVGMTERDVEAALLGTWKVDGRHYTREFEEGVGRACWKEKPRWCGDIRYQGKDGPIASIQASSLEVKADEVEAGLIAKYGQPISDTASGTTFPRDKKTKTLRWNSQGIAITFDRRNEYAPSDDWRISYVVGGGSNGLPL